MQLVGQIMVIVGVVEAHTRGIWLRLEIIVAVGNRCMSVSTAAIMRLEIAVA